MNNNDILSGKRKELELYLLQNPNLEINFEVKIRFQGLNPHPVFQVAKLEHKTTPASFIVTYIDFNSYSSRFNLWKNHILQPILRSQIHYLLLKLI